MTIFAMGVAGLVTYAITRPATIRPMTVVLGFLSLGGLLALTGGRCIAGKSCIGSLARSLTGVSGLATGVGFLLGARFLTGIGIGGSVQNGARIFACRAGRLALLRQKQGLNATGQLDDQTLAALGVSAASTTGQNTGQSSQQRGNPQPTAK